MKILVTGGLGVVGTPLVAELERRDHEVWRCDQIHNEGEHYVRCDIRQYRQLERLFKTRSFDCVYHLAAEFGRHNGEEYYENLWTTNVVGTKNIIRLQEEWGFRLVFFSSSEVYGDFDGVMKEDVMDKNAIRQLNDYAMTKWVSEMQVVNSGLQEGTDSVRVRLFNLYGPGEPYSPYRSAICVFCYRALKGIPYTVYTGHRRTSLYIDDAVTTLVNIAGKFRPGEVYNIGGEEFHDMKKVSDMVLSCLGRDDAIVEYREGEPWTTRDKRIDASKARRDLDHEPVISLAQGIHRTIDWMKSVYDE